MPTPGENAPHNATQPAVPQDSAAPADSSPPPTATGTHWLAGVWDRIKDHKVVQWTLAYAAFGYTTLHGMQMAREAFEWPLAVTRVTLLIALLGLPVAVTLAWYHGYRGRHRISSSELSILTVLLLIAGTLLWRFSGTVHEQQVSSAAVTATAPASATPGDIVPPAHSVAVLPFVNMSADKDQEYFSDGLSEELVNALALIDELQVAARTSSFSFKGQAIDVETIARKLHVGAVLEGSVRRSGNTVRVTVQLINATNGFHVWSHSYDRDLKDVLAVQSDIATAVAQQLQVKLLGNEADRIEVGATRNPQAYDAYLRATQLYSKAESEEHFRAALAAFDQAIALDSNFSAAYGGRAFSLLGIANGTFNLVLREDLQTKAREAADRAVALAPDFGDAHLAEAFVCQRTLHFGCAASEFDRARALAPGSARVQGRFARFADLLGHREAAQTAARRAVRLDPQNYDSHIQLASVLENARLFNEAIAAAQNAAALNPERRAAATIIAFSYLGLGRNDVARQTCESPATMLADDARHWCLALAYHALRRQPESLAELRKLQELGWGDARAVSYAGLYAQWGDTRSALDWLATAERTRASALGTLKVAWLLDPIRNEPEFKALERRLNFPP
jgi:TolB-like protein